MPRRIDRRGTLGLLLALVLGAGVQALLLDGALRRADRSLFERQTGLALNALVEVVERSGAGGDTVRAAVAAFAASQPRLASIRVLAGAQLVASTDPADAGEKAAPRRLQAGEKPLFDQGQRLRASVQTNRDEGAARKLEIETERGDGGAIALAAPFARDGEIDGFVRVQAVAPPHMGGAPLGTFLLLVAISMALMLALGAGLADRPSIRLAAGGGLLLLALLGGAVVSRVQVASAERRFATELASSAGQVLAAARLAASAVAPAEAPGRPAPEPGFAVSRWDQDPYRRPWALLREEGGLDPARVAEAARRAGASVWYATVWAWVLALSLYLFVAAGWAARLLQTLHRFRHAYAYAAPAVIGMVLLVFFPFFYGILLSFTDANIYNSNAPVTEIWLGLRNFADILGDFQIMKATAAGSTVDYQNFYWTLGFTVVWTVSNVVLGVIVGLALALILNVKGFRLRPVYRVLLVLPWAMPNYSTALIWKGMFHQQFGVVNQLIQVFGGQPLAWFERVGTSFVAVLATIGCLSFPFMMVISLGALQSIPAELYEAARVDGASRIQQFRAITLPSLKPTLVPAVILSVIWTFNMFNVIYLVSGGEPAHGTELLITQAYKFAFEQYRYGYAAAYSTIIFLILLAYGLWQNKVTRATEGI